MWSLKQRHQLTEAECEEILRQKRKRDADNQDQALFYIIFYVLLSVIFLCAIFSN